MNVDRLRLAIGFFRRAVELDPRSTLANQGMVTLHNNLTLTKIDNDPELVNALDFGLCLERAAAADAAAAHPRAARRGRAVPRSGGAEEAGVHRPGRLPAGDLAVARQALRHRRRDALAAVEPRDARVQPRGSQAGALRCLGSCPAGASETGRAAGLGGTEQAGPADRGHRSGGAETGGRAEQPGRQGIPHDALQPAHRGRVHRRDWAGWEAAEGLRLRLRRAARAGAGGRLRPRSARAGHGLSSHGGPRASRACPGHLPEAGPGVREARRSREHEEVAGDGQAGRDGNRRREISPATSGHSTSTPSASSPTSPMRPATTKRPSPNCGNTRKTAARRRWKRTASSPSFTARFTTP